MILTATALSHSMKRIKDQIDMVYAPYADNHGIAKDESEYMLAMTVAQNIISGMTAFQSICLPLLTTLCSFHDEVFKIYSSINSTQEQTTQPQTTQQDAANV